MRKKHYSLSRHLAAGDTVYIYAFVSLLFVKVGIAKNWRQRLASLKSENPFPIHKVTARSVPHHQAAEIEHRAHTLLAAHHHRGEWFRCPPLVARDAVAQAVAEARRTNTRPGHPPEFLDAAARAIALADGYRDQFIASSKERLAEIATQTTRFPKF